VPAPDHDAANLFIDGIADDLLDLAPRELLRALGRPTLIRVPGRGEQAPRAVSTLLHGDESTGFEAMLRILRRRRVYPFDLFVVIGNVRAALEGSGHVHRYLDDQEDFNRVWGLDAPTTQMRRAADAILARLRGAGLESLVDVHNNSGDNPFYAIVTRERNATLNLATLFTTTLVRWDLDAHTLMEALHDDVPSIAIECGKADRPESLAFAVDGLRRYLGEPPITDAEVVRDFDMIADLRKVVVRPEVRFTFGGDLSDDVDFVVAEDAEVHNFVEVPPGHVLGHVHPGSALPLVAKSSGADDVTDALFDVLDGVVVTRRAVTPIMMTRSVEAARKDCLFYVADELPPPRL